MFLCQDILEHRLACSLVKVAAGRIRVDLVRLNYVLFNFLLMVLTDLISCLHQKDNLVANVLTLVGENFTSLPHNDLISEPPNPITKTTFTVWRQPHWILTSVLNYFTIYF